MAHSRAQSRAQSRGSGDGGRPSWPYPDIAPRVAWHTHRKQWFVTKTRGGKTHFLWLGRDPLAALRKYRMRYDAFVAGRDVRISTPEDGRLTLRFVCNSYLADLEDRYERGDVGKAHRDRTHDLIAEFARFLRPDRDVASLGPADFRALMESWSRYAPTTTKKRVDQVGALLKWADANVPGFERPYTGTGFRAPPRRVLRRARNAKINQVFSAGEARAMLALADETMRAPILLALNMGAGASDMARFRRRDVDLVRGVYNGSRHKTEARRYAVLWPETVEAIRAYPEATPADAACAELLLLTRRGRPVAGTGFNNSAIRTRFDRMIREPLNLPYGFYTLKHTFVSVADEVGDDRAKKLITGHVDEDIIGHYSRVELDARVRRITEHVRAWLGHGPYRWLSWSP